MAITTTPSVVVEPASQEFADATSTPAFIYELTSAEARTLLDDVQAAPIDTDPSSRYFGAVLGDGTLHPGDEATSFGTRIADWLTQREEA